MIISAASKGGYREVEIETCAQEYIIRICLFSLLVFSQEFNTRIQDRLFIQSDLQFCAVDKTAVFAQVHLYSNVIIVYSRLY